MDVDREDIVKSMSEGSAVPFIRWDRSGTKNKDKSIGALFEGNEDMIM
jgi:hypothetical protein